MGLRHYIDVPEKNFSNVYRIEFDDVNYSLASTEIECTNTQPLQINQRVFDVDGRVWMKSKNVQISFPVSDATEEADFDYLFKNWYQNVKVQVFKNGVLDFSGYLDPQRSVKDLLTFPKTITVWASDGLDKAKEFLILDDDDEFPDPNQVEPIDVLVQAMTVLKTSLPINIRYNTYETTHMLSTEQMYKEINILNERFKTNENGVIKTDTVQEALQKVLLPFNCTLQQSGGKWWISSNYEIDSPIDQYDTAGTYISTDSTAVTVDLGDLCSTDRGTVSYTAMKWRLSIITRNRSFLGYANNNPQFRDGATDWNVGVDWSTADFINDQVILVDEDGYDPANNDYSLESDPFTVVGPGGDLDMVFDLRHMLTLISASSSSAPKIEFFYNIDGGLWNIIGTIYFDDFYLDVWRDYQVTRTVNTPTNFQMRLRVELSDDGSGSNVWNVLEYRFDQMSVVVNYAQDLVYDELTRIYNIDGPRIGEEELTQYFSGDAPNNTIASFKIKGNDGPFSFTRWGKTDNERLTGLLGLEILNRENSYRRLLTVNYHKTVDDLDTHNIILFDGKHYEILAYGFDVYNGVLNLNLKEMFDTTEADINYFIYNQELTTIDGQILT